MKSISKSFAAWLLCLALLLQVGLVQAERVSDIRATKHNFSSMGTGSSTPTGTVPSRTVTSSEDQVCVFCHTPHAASTQDQGGTALKSPLWNRRVPAGSTYTMYTSSSLDSQYITDGLSSQPGGSSKLCLSCHDGTLAIGNVNVLDGSSNVSITMSGTGTSGTGTTGVMPPGVGATTGFTRNLGTDLKNDHPISVTYDNTLATRDGELRALGTSQNYSDGTGLVIGLRAPGIKPLMPLEPTGAKSGATGQVQCATCHDPHIRETQEATVGNQKFLRLNRFQQGAPSGSFNRTNDIICLSCHERNGASWAFSAHAHPDVADETYKTTGTPTPSALREFPSAQPVWKASCLNCHDTHTVQGARRLLREGTDGTVTSGARGGGNPALENTCYQCHATTAASVVTAVTGTVPNIATEFLRASRMPIALSTEEHDIGGNFNDTGYINCQLANNKCGADTVESQSKLANRHAECTDCHNPHRVIRNPNGLPGALTSLNTKDSTGARHAHTDTAITHTNIISGALRGAWGVEPSYSVSASFQNMPTGFVVKRGDPGSNTDTAASNSYVTREYQICLKCHSNYGYADDNTYPSGTNRPLLGNTTGLTASPRTGFTRYTNQAKEFQAPSGHKAGPASTTDSGSSASYQTNNHRSWHPVMDSTGRTTAVRGGLVSSNWNLPFRNVGTQTMYCSDCHGHTVTSNTSVIPDSTVPWGPHGSSTSFILKGTWDTASGAGQDSTICFKCHSQSIYTGDGTRTGFWISTGRGSGKDGHKIHSGSDKISGGPKCNWCHVAVPHGWKNKALLVNLNDVGPEAGLTAGTQIANASLPYTNGPYYRNAMLKVDQFQPSGSWSLTSCGQPGTSEDTARSWMQGTCNSPP